MRACPSGLARARRRRFWCGATRHPFPLHFTALPLHSFRFSGLLGSALAFGSGVARSARSPRFRLLSFAFGFCGFPAFGLRALFDTGGSIVAPRTPSCARRFRASLCAAFFLRPCGLFFFSFCAAASLPCRPCFGLTGNQLNAIIYTWQKQTLF